MADQVWHAVDVLLCQAGFEVCVRGFAHVYREHGQGKRLGVLPSSGHTSDLPHVDQIVAACQCGAGAELSEVIEVAVWDVMWHGGWQQKCAV